MTLKICIEVPKDAGPYEAKVRIGATEQILVPGESIESYIYAGHEVDVSEVPAGTKAATASDDSRSARHAVDST